MWGKLLQEGVTLRDIDSVKLGTLKNILCVFQGGKIHGYELAKKTGISLGAIYDLLKILTKAGIIKQAGCAPSQKASIPIKYFTLTKNGKVLASILSEIIQ